MRKPTGSKRLKTCLLFFAAIPALFLSGCGIGSFPIFNITGNWFVYQITNTPTADVQVQGPGIFSFTQSDNDLTGTAWAPSPGLSNQAALGIGWGNISGLTIKFSFTGTDTPATTYTYAGTISSDDSSMSGTWYNSNGQSGSWFALTKAAPAANITGNWTLSYKTTDGTALANTPNPFTFNQPSSITNSTVTMDVFSGTAGTAPSSQAITGVLSGLNIAFPWTVSDGTVYFSTGTVSSDGKTMSGTWTGTNGQSGLWSASH